MEGPRVAASKKEASLLRGLPAWVVWKAARVEGNHLPDTAVCP